MRVIKVKAPEGFGKQIAELAFQAGASDVSFQTSKRVKSDNSSLTEEVITIETSTPKAKNLVESLMEAPFYDPKTFNFSVQHPESLWGSELPSKETKPLIQPSSDVYEDLWEYTNVTAGLLSRIFLSSLLLSYGMVEGYMPLIIASLLFLPYHHNLLAVGFSGCIREWRLMGQGLLAFLLSTLMIVAAGVVVALYLEPGIKFTEFSTPPFQSFLIAAVIGLAAGIGAVDDAGRHELIGLAATAHVSVYPAWFGLKFVYGFSHGDHPWEKLWVFGMDVVTIMVFSGIAFAIMKMNGKGIRRFIEENKNMEMEKKR
ncbi:DUF389 domain-containing protein [Nafulsella turpanensis]|uniref:DUF389 domain-containing protein n=1 Tax=Nafulsella turpanensis TaxID=1265690 RepID=UPI000344A15F|nr:DUF389 domain-containing protein [Nafulsella turpanensis]